MEEPLIPRRERRALSPFMPYIQKFMGKGYILPMLLLCICGCFGMKGDRQIQS
jgi:hypothetical protein